MFYYIFIPLIEQFSFLNLFKYITFRAGGALFTALIFSFICGPFIIKKLKSFQLCFVCWQMGRKVISGVKKREKKNHELVQS